MLLAWWEVGVRLGLPTRVHEDAPLVSLAHAGPLRDTLRDAAPRLASFSPPCAIFPPSSWEGVGSVTLLRCTVLEWLGGKSPHRFVHSGSVTGPALTAGAASIRPTRRAYT